MLAFAAFVSVLNTTMVNVAISLISRGLDVSDANAGWIITGFVLVFAIGIPIYGRLSDFFSLRTIFSLALVVFAAGSLVCALAPGFWVLIAGRALQAAGAAAITALSYGSIAKVFPPGGQGVAFGILSSAVGVGSAAGPILGDSARASPAGGSSSSGRWCSSWPVPRRSVRVAGHGLGGAGAVRNLDLPGGLLLGAAAGLTLFGITRIRRGPVVAVVLGLRPPRLPRRPGVRGAHPDRRRPFAPPSCSGTAPSSRPPPRRFWRSSPTWAEPCS